MSKYRLTLLMTLVAAGTSLLIVRAAGAVPEDVPVMPPWVNPDGSVDMEFAPERVPVVAPNGEPARDAQGRPVTVPFEAPLPPVGAVKSDSVNPANSTLEESGDGRVQTFTETIPPPPPNGAPYPLAGDETPEGLR